jgi:2-polyprenyl-3-methyl-5-hydroxy-6-metoxy-1,4-benzoquinol methylase
MNQPRLETLKPDGATLVTPCDPTKRHTCSVCHYQIAENDPSLLTEFPCNVRAFQNEVFHLWRCPQCQNIHCLEIVDLDRYYSQSPITTAIPDFARACFKNILKRLKRHGFSRSKSLLDYGCGNGLFVQYLKELGYDRISGYDPYSAEEKLHGSKILRQAPFDYILLQDVLEHVEDPHALLQQLDSLIAPGGYVFISTPNADRVDLSQPDRPEYYNEAHAPYHLHMYTPKTLEALGYQYQWRPIEFFERPYHDLKLGINSRFWTQYVHRFGGVLDVLYEPPQIWQVLLSPTLLIYYLFGYWLSFRTTMAIMFRKEIG